MLFDSSQIGKQIAIQRSFPNITTASSYVSMVITVDETSAMDNL